MLNLNNTDFFHQMDDLFQRMQELAAQVIRIPEPEPSLSCAPNHKTGSDVDNFAARCVSYLSYRAPSGAPNTHPRGLLITLRRPRSDSRVG